eukprot:1161688-Pelagomonas_calceolata.AAC.12
MSFKQFKLVQGRGSSSFSSNALQFQTATFRSLIIAKTHLSAFKIALKSVPKLPKGYPVAHRATFLNCLLLVSTEEQPCRSRQIQKVGNEMEKHVRGYVHHAYKSGDLRGESEEIRHDIAQAFSHFTWAHSNGQIIVSDIQGVGLTWTDPQAQGEAGDKAAWLGGAKTGESMPMVPSCHLERGLQQQCVRVHVNSLGSDNFGQCDLGGDGIQSFFASHVNQQRARNLLEAMLSLQDQMLDPRFYQQDSALHRGAWEKQGALSAQPQPLCLLPRSVILLGVVLVGVIYLGKGYIAVPACGGSLAEARRACNQTSPN